jgi:antitoxin HigA-1
MGDITFDVHNVWRYVRLARYFGTTERFWLNLQSRYDLELERDRLAPALEEIEPLARA